jgi:uncharacterized protein (UPF0248 family)
MTAKTVKDLLNKIKWDKREKAEDYDFYYLDRIDKKLKKIAYSDIAGVEGSFIKTKDKLIPLHRIKEVRKRGQIVLSRKL